MRKMYFVAEIGYDGYLGNVIMPDDMMAYDTKDEAVEAAKARNKAWSVSSWQVMEVPVAS